MLGSLFDAPATSPNGLLDSKEDEVLGGLFNEEDSCARSSLLDGVDEDEEMGLDVIFEEEEDASNAANPSYGSRWPAAVSTASQAVEEEMDVEDEGEDTAAIPPAADSHPDVAEEFPDGQERSITRSATVIVRDVGVQANRGVAQ